MCKTLHTPQIVPLLSSPLRIVAPAHPTPPSLTPLDQRFVAPWANLSGFPHLRYVGSVIPNCSLSTRRNPAVNQTRGHLSSSHLSRSVSTFILYPLALRRIFLEPHPALPVRTLPRPLTPSRKPLPAARSALPYFRLCLLQFRHVCIVHAMSAMYTGMAKKGTLQIVGPRLAPSFDPQRLPRPGLGFEKRGPKAFLC